MKIVFFTPLFLPFHSRSGISNVAYTIARTLKNHEFIVYTPDYHFSDVMTQNIEKYENIEIRRLPYINKQYPLTPSMLYVKRGFDLIHSFHYGYFSSVAGMINSLISGKPHIFTTAYHPPVRRSVSRSIYGSTLGRLTLRVSDIVVPFNDSEKKELEKISKANYEIISPPVNEKIFFPKRRKNSIIRIGYIGPFLEWKGYKIAFDIFRSLEKKTDAEFLVIFA